MVDTLTVRARHPKIFDNNKNLQNSFFFFFFTKDLQPIGRLDREHFTPIVTDVFATRFSSHAVIKRERDVTVRSESVQSALNANVMQIIPHDIDFEEKSTKDSHVYARSFGALLFPPLIAVQLATRTLCTCTTVVTSCVFKLKVVGVRVRAEFLEHAGSRFGQRGVCRCRFARSSVDPRRTDNHPGDLTPCLLFFRLLSRPSCIVLF